MFLLVGKEFLQAPLCVSITWKIGLSKIAIVFIVTYFITSVKTGNFKFFKNFLKVL